MKRVRLWVHLVLAGSAMAASAALEFTNQSQVLAPLALPSLRAAAWDGASSFLAVGTNSSTLLGTFDGSQMRWAKSATPSPTTSLGAAAYGLGVFLAGGDDSLAYQSSDGTNWLVNGPPFGATPYVTGTAYSQGSGRFVMVGSAKLVSYGSLTGWTAAGLPGGSFLESYRAVTPLGESGFALCGIRGNIRTSADGSDWAVSRAWSSAEKDLFGIAWNRSQTLVAVGADGTVLVSTNSGGGWLAASSGSAANLLAVAHGTAEFVAVGDGGTVVTSPDGLNGWGQAGSGTQASLAGVVFATAGILNGVGMIVGADGTVILAGTPPPMPTNAQNRVNCAQSLPNPALEAMVAADATHPPGTVTIDWFAQAEGGVAITNSTSFLPPDTFAPSNAPATYTYYAQARDLRTGIVNPSRLAVTLTLNPRPTSLVSGSATICNGESVLIQAQLTGLGPWTLRWSDGLEQTTNAAPGSSAVAVRLVSPGNALPNAPSIYTYTVTNLTDANCSATAESLTGSAVIVVNPLPTAVVSGSATICNGEMAVIQAQLTGLGPWTVRWSDGFEQTVNAEPGSPGTAVRQVTPVNPLPNLPTNYTYTVTNLTDANCTPAPGGLSGSASITVNPRPTSLVSGSATICNGETAVIQAQLTGLGPWTVRWSDGFAQTTNAAPGSSAVAVRTVNPGNPLANLPTNYTYTVTNLTDANCTAATLDRTGSAVITVDPRPTATLLSLAVTNCNVGATYTLTNTLTGRGPWRVEWNDGVVQSNTPAGPGPAIVTRTVSPYSTNLNSPSNFTYFVTAVSDASGCGGDPIDDLSGAVVITIQPRPTATLLSLAATNCNVGATYTLTNTLTGRGPWRVEWNDGVVQSNTPAGPGPAIVTRTVSPYSTNLNSPSNFTYFVTAVSDANGCGGDPVDDLSGGAVITIHPRPTARLLSFTATNCNVGVAYTLTNTLTGRGPWVLQWNDGYRQTNLSVVAGPVILTRTVIPTNSSANLPSNNTFQVTAVTDANGCGGVPGEDISGVVQVTVNPLPALYSLGNQTNCVGAIPNPPLAVVVSNGVAVDWFAADGTTQVATNTPIYTPTNTAAGIYTYLAQARGADTGCVNPVRVAVLLVLQDCPVYLDIARSGPNVVLRWYGNLELQSTNALTTNAQNWRTVTNGLAGVTNTWVTPPTNAQEYYQLSTP